MSSVVFLFYIQAVSYLLVIQIQIAVKCWFFCRTNPWVTFSQLTGKELRSNNKRHSFGFYHNLGNTDHQQLYVEKLKRTEWFWFQEKAGETRNLRTTLRRFSLPFMIRDACNITVLNTQLLNNNAIYIYDSEMGIMSMFTFGTSSHFLNTFGLLLKTTTRSFSALILLATLDKRW